MNPTIELIYAADCPNVSLARRHLTQALAAARSDVKWQEWDRDAKDTPAHARRYGSPTILINGDDVAGSPADNAGNCCRLYTAPDGTLQRAPSVENILQALAGGRSSRMRAKSKEVGTEAKGDSAE